MFFAHFKNNGEDFGGLYRETAESWNEFEAMNNDPIFEKVSFVYFHVTGKTYAKRQDCLCKIALDYQAAASNYPFSYSELAAIGAWMEKQARRYGLLREFRENGIC